MVLIWKKRSTKSGWCGMRKALPQKGKANFFGCTGLYGIVQDCTVLLSETLLDLLLDQLQRSAR
jgi:hypothetical protein